MNTKAIERTITNLYSTFADITIAAFTLIFLSVAMAVITLSIKAQDYTTPREALILLVMMFFPFWMGPKIINTLETFKQFKRLNWAWVMPSYFICMSGLQAYNGLAKTYGDLNALEYLYTVGVLMTFAIITTLFCSLIAFIPGVITIKFMKPIISKRSKAEWTTPQLS